MYTICLNKSIRLGCINLILLVITHKLHHGNGHRSCLLKTTFCCSKQDAANRPPPFLLCIITLHVFILSLALVNVGRDFFFPRQHSSSTGNSRRRVTTSCFIPESIPHCIPYPTINRLYGKKQSMTQRPYLFTVMLL